MTAMPVRLPPRGMNFFRPAMAVEVGFRPGYASRAGRALAGLGEGSSGNPMMDFWGGIIGAVGGAAGGIANAFAAPANAAAAQANAAAAIAAQQAQAQRDQLAADSKQTTMLVIAGVAVAGIAAYVFTR